MRMAWLLGKLVVPILHGGGKPVQRLQQCNLAVSVPSAHEADTDKPALPAIGRAATPMRRPTDTERESAV